MADVSCYLEGLRASGFESHYNEIDADYVDEKIPCPECNSKMRYVGMKKENYTLPNTYISLAVCMNPDCECSVEF